MDPQVQSLIDMLRAATPANAPRLWELEPAVARAAADVFFARFNTGGPAMADVHDLLVPGRRGPVAARLYVPRGANSVSPGLLYLHGGGFVIGSPATHDRLVRDLADGIGARVVSLDYSLAPECPYPAGLHDCVDASVWLAQHGAEIGIDPRRLLIGGDSAGANLSAATILKLRDEGRAVGFRAALLIYGRFAPGDTPSIGAWGDRDLVLSRPVMNWFHGHYVGKEGRQDDPYIAPLLAGLAGFPPAIVIAGTLDPLVDDSRLFASALEKAGVPVELHVYDDGIHAFVQMPMFLDMAGDAIARMCEFARRAVGV